MKRTAKVVVATALMVPLSATAALAATMIGGTPYGDALYGTPYADTIYGYGGADLIYGYGGNDSLYGGNESGFGDKILGGYGDDRVFGQNGDDALYGEGGNDRVDGGYGDDLVQGGYGYDTLSGGPGADRINAREGQKDTINVCGSGYGDVVYYDRGLDVLVGCPSAQGTQTTALTAEEAIEAGKVKLVAAKPPKGVFEHTGKVLIEQDGKEKLVAEKELKKHVKDGAKIVDPTGRAGAEGAQR
ncbi:MAG: hypothetical protein M3P49_15425 [Actinomycetota bacterium]|nr:hypothetical protein [Actinomycetota bacterium]